MPQTDLFTLVSLRQRWLEGRFALLAQNVANADTPGYRPRDLPPESFARILDKARQADLPGGLVRTHAQHLDAASSSTPELRPRERTSPEVAPSGNAVILAEELRRLGEIQRNWQLDVNLIAKYRRFHSTVLGAGR